MVAAGLEQVISFIKNFKLSREEAEWLKESSNGSLTDGFLDYLQNFKFNGTVNAVPEGTVVFPNEPIVTVTGNSIDVQLFETYILSVMNFQTMVATKIFRYLPKVVHLCYLIVSPMIKVCLAACKLVIVKEQRHFRVIH